MMLIRRSREHLKEAQKTYLAHGEFAIKAGFMLLYASLTSFVHGVIPACFPFLSRDIVLSLADKIRQGTETRGT